MNSNFSFKLLRRQSAFSLAEVLVTLTIGAIILVAGISLYRRAENSARAVTAKFESSRQAFEVLQRIAEDLDKIISPEVGTKITVENKIESHGYPTAKLVIVKTYYDKEDKKEIFEEITWQGYYDFDSSTEGLILYRSHRGIDLEDKLLDKSKKDWEKELFVPICPGVTFFKIQIPNDDKLEDGWTADSLPKAVVITISFAEPFETVEGQLDVPEEEKVSRTIAIDRTRKIKFIFKKEENIKGKTVIDKNGGLTQKK